MTTDEAREALLTRMTGRRDDRATVHAFEAAVRAEEWDRGFDAGYKAGYEAGYPHKNGGRGRVTNRKLDMRLKENRR